MQNALITKANNEYSKINKKDLTNAVYRGILSLKVVRKEARID